MKMHLKNKGIHPIIFIVIGNIILFISTSFLNLPKSRQWADDLLDESTFKNPDKGYYPETWFHFIGGNISKEGITADLEAISAAGISGIQLFHGQFGGAWPGVSPQIKCLSESWEEHIRWTAKECKRLNLNFTMQNCPGWSYAGGPWIKPENSMRHLVYSRTDIEGGSRKKIQLTKPQESEEEWRDYEDLFVVAFPTPEDDTGNRLIPKEIKSNRDVLLNRLSVNNGKMITPEGISYRILWLYDCKRMLPETLEKILSFVKQGIIVVGSPPDNIATLSGGKEAELRFRKVVKELWGNGEAKVRKVGKGKVYRSDIESVLDAEKIQKDINVGFSDVHWLHRRTADADFYFVSTPIDKGYKGNISFRSKGFAEIWDPLTGEITKASSTTNKNGCAAIEMNMPAGTSRFVVFRKNESRQAKAPLFYTKKMEMQTPWEIRFSPGWGIPDSPVFIDQLKPWKDLPLTEEGKSFSGTAVYTASFNMDKKEGIHYSLDMGQVEVIAKVKLNGKDVGTKWTYPYRMEITDYLKTGKNTLEIAVTSTWHNRLVYDANLPEWERKTWTIAGPDSQSPLKEYGLIGPVWICYE